MHALLTPLLPDHIPIPRHTSRCHVVGTLQLKKHLACSKPGMGKWFPPPCQATHARLNHHPGAPVSGLPRKG